MNTSFFSSTLNFLSPFKIHSISALVPSLTTKQFAGDFLSSANIPAYGQVSLSMPVGTFDWTPLPIVPKRFSFKMLYVTSTMLFFKPYPWSLFLMPSTISCALVKFGPRIAAVWMIPRAQSWKICWCITYFLRKYHVILEVTSRGLNDFHFQFIWKLMYLYWILIRAMI